MKGQVSDVGEVYCVCLRGVIKFPHRVGNGVFMNLIF